MSGVLGRSSSSWQRGASLGDASHQAPEGLADQAQAGRYIRWSGLFSPQLIHTHLEKAELKSVAHLVKALAQFRSSRRELGSNRAEGAVLELGDFRFLSTQDTQSLMFNSVFGRKRVWR